jgi:hypothetical protein
MCTLVCLDAYGRTAVTIVSCLFLGIAQVLISKCLVYYSVLCLVVLSNIACYCHVFFYWRCFWTYC